MKTINIGTINVRGLTSKFKEETLIEDIRKYNLDITTVTETHIKEEEDLRKYNKYTGFFVNENNNRHHGCGIIIKEELNPTFKKLHARICTAKLKLKTNHLHVISAYFPANSKTKETQEICQELYDIIQQEIDKIPKRDYLFIAGDFNAKVGTNLTHQYPENIGKYSKGNANPQGINLLNFCAENNLVITNTVFKHKTPHITTWTAPFRNFKQNGENRRNPIRNQIDYIITRINDKTIIKDSRSYGGIKTETDHKLVKAKIELKIHKQKQKQSKQIQINYTNFSESTLKTEYQNRVEEQLQNIEKNETPQEKWNKTKNILLETAEKVLGKKERTSKIKQQNLEQLKQESQKIRKQIEQTKNQNKAKELRKQRKQINKQIHKIIKDTEERDVEELLKDIEAKKDDSNKYYEAQRKLKNRKPKKPLIVKNDKGEIAGNAKEKIKIITDHFQKMLGPEEHKNNIKTYQPKEMEERFNENEIEKAIKSLKNNKSPGIDNIQTELIKNAQKNTYNSS